MTTKRPRARRRRTSAGEASDEVAGTVERLATLLEAGVAPDTVWLYLAEFSTHPVIGSVAGAVAAGERPVDAFTRSTAIRARRAEAWRSLAAAWAIADACGAPLAPSLRELGGALRDRAQTERAIEVGLAGPVATSRLVGWLPLVGLALGTLMGVDALGTLFGSLAGGAVLAGGLVLMAGGHVWTKAMVARAAPPPGAPGLRLDLVAVALTGGVSAGRSMSLVEGALARFGVRTAADEGLAGILALAERAGAPAADLLRSAARQLRRDARTSGQRSATALAVRLMLPLGICVLPAFMLLGVAPVVLSIVSSTVGTL
jgi:tight adherence protein B